MIGSETQEALRGRRNHMLKEHHVLLQAGGKEKEFLKPDALGAAVTRR